MAFQKIVPKCSQTFLYFNIPELIMLKIFEYEKKTGKLTLLSPEKFPKELSENKNYWFHYLSPTDKDFRNIKRIINLHKLSVEDCLSEVSRTKLEHFNEYIFVSIEAPLKDREDIVARELDVMIGKNWVISSSLKDIPTITEFTNQKESIKILLKEGPDGIGHHLIDIAVDDYFPILERIEVRIDEIEDNIFNRKTPRSMSKVLGLKTSLARAKKNAVTQQDVIMHLRKKEENPYISKRTRTHLREVHDHMIRISNILDNYRERITNIIEVHLLVINNRMNEIMKVLTVIATIMMPLTLLSSIYGMNFEHMPELNWRWGYPTVITFMLIVAGFMVFYFKKKRWI